MKGIKPMSLLSIFVKHGASLLAKKICEEIASKLSHRLILRRDGRPYLWRSYFTSEVDADPDIGIFLHKFVGDDDPGIVHNHPWVWCVSMILAGSYFETRYKWNTETLRLATPPKSAPPAIDTVRLHSKSTRVLAPFDVNIINHEDMHRVSLVGEECWTLFIHGPRVSTWGFALEASGRFIEVTERTRAEERDKKK
jgi:hypothetical protein